MLVKPTKLQLKRFKANIVVTNDCWLWCAGLSKGYAVFNLGKTRAGYRLSYMWFVGPIQKGNDVHHKCGNKNCVNPSHLESVTRGWHIAKTEKRYANSEKTHCKNGHEFTTENTAYYGSRIKKSRVCKQCRRKS